MLLAILLSTKASPTQTAFSCAPHASSCLLACLLLLLSVDLLSPELRVFIIVKRELRGLLTISFLAKEIEVQRASEWACG